VAARDRTRGNRTISAEPFTWLASALRKDSPSSTAIALHFYAAI
jgi:hypothetical protein